MLANALHLLEDILDVSMTPVLALNGRDRSNVCSVVNIGILLDGNTTGPLTPRAKGLCLGCKD